MVKKRAPDRQILTMDNLEVEVSNPIGIPLCVRDPNLAKTFQARITWLFNKKDDSVVRTRSLGQFRQPFWLLPYLVVVRKCHLKTTTYDLSIVSYFFIHVLVRFRDCYIQPINVICYKTLCIYIFLLFSDSFYEGNFFALASLARTCKKIPYSNIKF